jgi:hypothetical protein
MRGGYLRQRIAVRFPRVLLAPGMTDMVKVFGCRQAY